jgi:hypothetical protein
MLVENRRTTGKHRTTRLLPCHIQQRLSRTARAAMVAAETRTHKKHCLDCWVDAVEKGLVIFGEQ